MVADRDTISKKRLRYSLRKRTARNVTPGVLKRSAVHETHPQSEQRQAFDELFSLIYEDLRRLASFVRKNEANNTLNSTALVHEAWLKLKDSPHLSATSEPHFKSIAAKAMRQVLVDEARRRTAQKRGGVKDSFVDISSATEQMISCDEEFLALDIALNDLARLNPRQAQMVESRFFGGLNVPETAELLGVSESVIDRDWRAAKAWLTSRVRAGME